MDNDISENNQDNKDNYGFFYKSIISRIKQAKNNMEIIKEKAIYETTNTHWLKLAKL
ncbi:MAG: hypothetical protein KIT56_05700 [Gammaproteobacteria bacterium]|nr:hypothetical protein [Gammaproteobacteria bacterium]MCW5583363.1 hypothetical protein [Gammaproteobacteria bacterium]